ncbi:luciferase family protein [Paenibacillus sacheonensis]|uniref:Luciferase domain-containing protein n=1 Tax=Paenibacillus sacheonensis TaxID=742054 RepID=A0A7X4YN09_9BACL|nr:luciferase family protein [Paenibacillus sacheonensis]MBM7564832.1 hypothetical protein [Paenibacillus sacheonensis]NBC69380.1 hypothetical protein [Paenibacillus sacheonensis]
MSWNGGTLLTNVLLGWPGVTTQPHRFGGVEFRVHDHEIGHLHGDRLFDLLVPRTERGRWIDASKAQPHHIYPESNWVSVYLNTEQDVAGAIEIAKSNYERFKPRGRDAK